MEKLDCKISWQNVNKAESMPQSTDCQGQVQPDTTAGTIHCSGPQNMYRMSSDSCTKKKIVKTIVKSAKVLTLVEFYEKTEEQNSRKLMKNISNQNHRSVPSQTEMKTNFNTIKQNINGPKLTFPSKQVIGHQMESQKTHVDREAILD